MTDPMFQVRLSLMLDRSELSDLVCFERFCRDQRDFAGMLACYVKNSPVRTTWFDGTVEDFAEASRKKMSSGSQAKHWIMPARIDIHDTRALVESTASIFDRLTFDGIEFDTFQYCRFVSRAVRTAEGWKLKSRVVKMDVKFSAEKGLAVEKGGGDAWVKFLVRESDDSGQITRASTVHGPAPRPRAAAGRAGSIALNATSKMRAE